MTRKPQIGNLTNMIEFYPFLESERWYLLFKGIVWSRESHRHILQVQTESLLSEYCGMEDESTRRRKENL